MNRTATTRVTITALTLVVAAALLNAGPLTPPPGPIVSTGKTLTEVEPRIAISATNTPGDADSLFKITQPGSYYLTGKITGVLGKHGIEIAASGVTLDLNGFELAGVAGSLDGIAVPAVARALTVRNGLVSDWGGNGVGSSFSLVLGEVEGVRVQRCLGNGIAINDQGVVRNCTVTENATGINVGSRTLITGCVVTFSTSNGIVMTNSSTVIGCVVGNNTGRGIIASGGGGAVLDSTIFASGSDGISAGPRTTISRCTVTVNTLNGIVLGNECVALNNTCGLNGSGGFGAGIQIAGINNKVEGNHCSGADRGIDVNGSGNFIIKNTCSGNSINWEIAVGNSVAPIMIAATNAAVISGNSYGGNLGSTDPNANFTY